MPDADGDAMELLIAAASRDPELAPQVAAARREHARLRRREHELTALFSSARELAEERDGEALLARLVQRAHEMTGADVTYLSQFDPATRELRVHATSGSVSEAFRRLRVPPGRGLASMVVESRSPQWTTRYDDVRRDRHERGIDDAVAAEGLVALLGVPMRTGEAVLGVLFVAYRDEHVFAPEEVALLSALADHASVVLQTARILGELRASEDETRGALARLTEHVAERDRANAVHQELVQAVLAGGGYAPVAQTLAVSLGRPTAVVDEEGSVVAASGLPLPPAMLDLDPAALDAIEASARTGHCVPLDGDGLRDVSAVSAGARRFGAILLGAGEFPLGPVDRRTVERAAQVCALLALQQEAAADAEQRLQSELVAELLDATPGRRADLARRARRMGVILDELDELVLLDLPSEHRDAAVRVLGQVLGSGSVVGEHRGYVVALAPSAGEGPTPDRLRERVVRATRSPVLAIASPPAASPAATFAGAVRTARLLAALGVVDGVESTADYLPYSAVLDADAAGLELFLDDMLGAVRRYDRERGTDLLGTLRAFVRSNASPTRTARALHFHTNTILQRLERLDAVLGAGWRDDERLFRIGMAVRLDELRERVAPRPA